MPASPLTPDQYERRMAIRKVAAQAKRAGWEWHDGINGWRLPDGDFVDLDRLFRSSHPLDFILEAAYTVIPAVQAQLTQGEANP